MFFKMIWKSLEGNELLNTAHLTEVLLTTVLSSFKISYAKESKDVVWNLASVRYPTIGPDSTLPACPITLERIRD